MVPSERTRLSISGVDSSIRGLCPTYPGALVLHLGGLGYSSVMIGALPETSFNLDLQAISLLLLDDINSVAAATSAHKLASLNKIGRSNGGVWKVFCSLLWNDLNIDNL